MASRYVCFDVSELAKIAASAVGANSCVHVEKFAGGMHNKTLLLRMDDGKEVVAKVPNPNAGQPHLTTASEVATLEYMRTVLSTPVPEVYAWCSRADETSVGAEYIIMEKAPGVPLETVWRQMELQARFDVVKQIAALQKTWSLASFAGYGCLYYASDLTNEQRLPLKHSNNGSQAAGKFALGPMVGRSWVDDGRDSVDFDRGPWPTVREYVEAIGKREMACVKGLPRLPPTQVTLCGPGTYQSTRDKKLRALQYYLQLCKYLLPSQSGIRKPAAWHGDLHVENVFVDPSKPTKVSCIIDWQSSEVAPLFVQAQPPYILDHSGPQAEGLDEPDLPPNYNDLSPGEQTAADWLLIDQSLCVGYKRWVRAKLPNIWECFEYQETPEFLLLLLARDLLVDGEAIYAARIVEYLQENEDASRKTGLSIPPDVAAEIIADSEGALRGMDAMSSVEKTIGDLFPKRGCVRPEQYDEAKDALSQCKEQIIEMFATSDAERAAWEESWPFDD